jgi:hypothetical protein
MLVTDTARPKPGLILAAAATRHLDRDAGLPTREPTARHLRLAQDAQFHVFFLAAPWTTLVAAGVVASIGTIAFGTDTESGWTSVRTAVENRFTPVTFTRNFKLHTGTQPHDFSHDFTSAAPSFRRAYATFCYSRPWPTFAHASLRPQRTCLRVWPCIFAPSPLATRLIAKASSNGQVPPYYGTFGRYLSRDRTTAVVRLLDGYADHS